MAGLIRISDAELLVKLGSLNAPASLQRITELFYRAKSSRTNGVAKQSLELLAQANLCDIVLETIPGTTKKKHCVYSPSNGGRRFIEAFVEAGPYIAVVGSPHQIRFFINTYATCGGWSSFVNKDVAEASHGTLTLNACGSALTRLLGTPYLESGVERHSYRFTEDAFEAYLVLGRRALEPLTAETPPPFIRMVQALKTADRPLRLKELTAAAHMTPNALGNGLRTPSGKTCIQHEPGKGYSLIPEAMSERLLRQLERYR